MQRVRHDGRETAYVHVRPGVDGPRMLYVHGSGGSHAVWGHQYDRGPAPAVGIDLSGHGRSEDISTEAGPATLSAYAADVLAVARATDADVLVGNSLGGAVLLKLLAKEAYNPAGVVLAGTGAKLAVAEHYRTALAEEFDRAIELLHREDRLFHEPAPEVLDRSIEAMLAVGQAVTRRDFMTAHTFDVRNRLAAIETPALAVVGEHDRLTPPWYHEYLAAELPHCGRAVVADAAHLAMIEQPRAFTAAVEAFLDGLSAY